jgi:DNA gyrase/topoisomerase IV subunit A
MVSAAAKCGFVVHIEKFDNKVVLIKDVPFGVTVPSLIESIVKGQRFSGKIKIKKVTDNTAAEVEIEIQLGRRGYTPTKLLTHSMHLPIAKFQFLAEYLCHR